QAVRADRRDREAPECQRRQDRSRDRPLRRRPRHPPHPRTRPRTDRPTRTPVDRRRRRPRMGPRPQRTVLGGVAVLEARPPARNPGLPEVLPPRDDRALPRSPGRGPQLVPPGAHAEPALLGAVGAGREKVRVVRRLTVLVALLTLALLAPLATKAHPLGNFTINRYSELDVSGNRLYDLYVLDLAEIPTFQAKQAGGIDGVDYARRIASHVSLTVDGTPARLVPVRHVLAFPPGQGDLHTTRLEVLLSGPVLHDRTSVVYHDNNFSGRIGWKEVVVTAGTGARLVSSSAPASSVSDRLLAYPKNLLQSPLDGAPGRGPGAGPGASPCEDARAARRSQGRFRRRLRGPDREGPPQRRVHRP